MLAHWNEADSDAGSILMQLVWQAADTLCVASYYSTALAEVVRRAGSPSPDQPPAVQVRDESSSSTNAVGVPSTEKVTPFGQKPETKQAPEPEQSSELSRSQTVDRLVTQLGANTPEISAKIGATFLEQALSSSPTGADLSPSLIELALASLRHGAESTAVKIALENNAQNRDYAALLGNLALAEDIGIPYKMGTMGAALEAIRAADALGGSSSAYELAASYAMKDADPVSAAILYARAYAQLPALDRKEPLVTDGLIKNFQLALSKAGHGTGIDIAQFDSSRLVNFQPSNWYSLAMDLPRNFAFKGIRVARGISAFEKSNMSFFVAGSPPGTGADLGGLAGADGRCQQLALAVGAGGKTWRAYLSTNSAGGQINARDRIGNGPWQNAKGVVIAKNVDELHSDKSKIWDSALTERGTTIPVWRYDSEKKSFIDIKADKRNDPGIANASFDWKVLNGPVVLTGSTKDGRAYSGNVNLTCNNWTSSSRFGSAMVGYVDYHMQTGGSDSWNSGHVSEGCSEPKVTATSGDVLFYCFAQ